MAKHGELPCGAAGKFDSVLFIAPPGRQVEREPKRRYSSQFMLSIEPFAFVRALEFDAGALHAGDAGVRVRWQQQPPSRLGIGAMAE
jgi:hypothetical protein